MKTIDIPEPEATKLRLIRELPYKLQPSIDSIIEAAGDWQRALCGIDVFLSFFDGADKIKEIRSKFKLPGPIGQVRKVSR